MAEVATLLHRVEALEKKRFACPHEDVIVDEQMRRARLAVEHQALYSTNWKWVAKDYYTWTLSQRAKTLEAPSTDYLCKSLLMENRKAPETGDDPTNPRFVLVVLQYEATLDTKKLINAIRALRPVADRLDDTHFDIRIASEEDNARITGYDNNAVVPFGMKESSVPIILSKPIVPLRYFWMGGGHIHLKLRMTVADFSKALSPIVADISQPRTSSDPEP
ncbi:Pfam:YbaK [Seminavis robusta]|uniref:Pfam:YbaK n=1 Tax=Seminavis robusta TaxID=568900 RepID=A0A9N8EV31_9STRA|nr:Pfam:YbaK [Seminavis robusta]|eukprot:Sro1653_g288860.1 Pfam:YbaK (220) ;mRNA; r:16962-17621